MICINKDKILHFTISLYIFMLLQLIFIPFLSAAITLAIGVGKELIWDKWLGYGQPDMKDMYANVLGIMVGLLLVL